MSYRVLNPNNKLYLNISEKFKKYRNIYILSSLACINGTYLSLDIFLTSRSDCSFTLTTRSMRRSVRETCNATNARRRYDECVKYGKTAFSLDRFSRHTRFKRINIRRVSTRNTASVYTLTDART